MSRIPEWVFGACVVIFQALVILVSVLWGVLAGYLILELLGS